MTEIYAAHAHEYRKKGYSPLPLPAGQKASPPDGWTGIGAPMASGPDVQAWTETNADGNIALRLPDGVIGIDIDDYGTKPGWATFMAAYKAIGVKPPSAGKLTSRGTETRAGIRLFRVPAGTKLAGNFASAGFGPDVDIIQNHHRYCVGPASVHPEGGTYTWYELDGSVGELPAVAELPELPQAWIDALQPKAREDRADIPHDAYDEMASELKVRIDGYTDRAVDGILAELTEMKSWPEDYRHPIHGYGWEEGVLALTASLASLVKADWNSLDVADVLSPLEDALPTGGKFTLGNGMSKFARGIQNERVEARVFPDDFDDSWFDRALEKATLVDFRQADGGEAEPSAQEQVEIELNADDWPREAWNEEGHVERTKRWAVGSLRWLTNQHIWVRYNGVHWERDPRAGAKAARQALKVARWTEQENYDDTPKVDEKTGQAKPESSERAKFVKRLSDDSTDRMFNSVARVLSTEPDVEADSSDFDQDEYLLGVANGTVDLRTGELIPGTPEQMISMACPVEYDPAATAPRFQEYLEESIPSKDVRLYLQRVVGYSISGSTLEQAMFMHYGETTNNGKSVLMYLIEQMLGEYSGVADPKALIESRNDQHTTHIAGLDGPRVLMMSETARGARLSDVLVKQITGGDRITARKIAQDGEKYRIVGKIHMATNHLPHIVASKSTNRRIHVVPWPVEIDNDKIDLELREKLAATELPGILTWAVEGAKAWYAQMKDSQTLKDGERPSGLGMPVEVRQATDKYLGDEDQIGQWMDERTQASEALETASNLYRDYKWWTESRGERPMTQTAFSLDLKKHGVEPKRTSSANGFVLALRPLQQNPASSNGFFS